MTTKKEVSKAIRNVLEKLTYDSTIHWPDYDSIDIEECKNIAPYFKNDLVTEWVVNYTIYDLARAVTRRENHSPLTISEISKLVEDTYNYLKSLPRKYLFVFPLPEGDISNTSLSDDIQVRKVDEAFSQSLIPVQAPNQSVGGIRALLGGVLSGPSQPVVNKGENILEVKASGYVNNSATARLYGTDPLFALKVVVGAYIASGVFEDSSQLKSGGYGIAPTYSFYAFDITQSLEFLRRFDESNDDKKLLDKYVFKNSLGSYNWANEALTKLLSNQRLKYISNIQAQLKNGLYWYYESNKSNLAHFQAVFIVSALDSFFTKDDSAPHKANVIAAAIADNFNWESQVKKYVPQLYSLRNDVVHGQKAIGVYNQSPEERAGEDFLIWKCRAILRQFLVNRLKAFHELS